MQSGRKRPPQKESAYSQKRTLASTLNTPAQRTDPWETDGAKNSRITAEVQLINPLFDLAVGKDGDVCADNLPRMRVAIRLAEKDGEP